MSGLCWRYHGGMRETFRRIHDGAIGDIVAMQRNYNTGTALAPRPPAGWSDMEWQMRNWLYFTWLSGDFNVEQHVHSLDKMAVGHAAIEPPVRCVGLGGRQVRTGRNLATSSITWPCVYEFANGVKCFSFCRQQAGCAIDVNDYVLGTPGKVDVMDHSITGPNAPGVIPPPSAARRHVPDRAQRAVRRIRAGNVDQQRRLHVQEHDDGDHGPHGLLHRPIDDLGQATNSQEDLSPPRYDWIELPVPPVARPGMTRLR